MWVPGCHHGFEPVGGWWTVFCCRLTCRWYGALARTTIPRAPHLPPPPDSGPAPCSHPTYLTTAVGLLRHTPPAPTPTPPFC